MAPLQRTLPSAAQRNPRRVRAAASERQRSDLMAVTFHIPTYLAPFAGDSSSVALNSAPANVQEALQSLWRLHPALRDRIVDEQGEVRQHINIFVGNECIRFTGGLETPVPDGAELMIVPAVSGGV